jgi:Capsule polysaccharide biosynthesis protein
VATINDQPKSIKRVIFFTHALSDALFNALKSENIQIVAVIQGHNANTVSITMHDLFEGGGSLARFPTQLAPFQWLDDTAFRIYARCIARLGFIPGSNTYETISGGIVQASDLEEWARSHMNFALQLLNGVKADEVWFGVQPHLGLDNIMELVALRSGRTVLTLRQIPFALKFYYFVEKFDPKRSSYGKVFQEKTVPKLDWLPWQAGATAPNLFYMQENIGRSWSVGIVERMRYFAKYFSSLNFAPLMERAYIAARKRRWYSFMLILEHLSARNRPVAFIRWYSRTRFERTKKLLLQKIASSACLEKKANDEPYIYFALHLEPELNTQILGYAYHNQLDALVALHQALPSGWKIRIKENPKQTYLHRGTAYFKRLATLENIVQVAFDASSAELIKHAAVIATITGTAGYESAIAGKVCVYFGLPWYAGLPGTFAFDENIDLVAIAKLSVSKSALDEGMNQLMSELADGLIFPRFTGIYEHTHDMRAVAQTTAASLRTISDAAE